MTNIADRDGPGLCRFRPDAGDLQRQPHASSSAWAQGRLHELPSQQRPGRRRLRLQPHAAARRASCREVLARAFALFDSAPAAAGAYRDPDRRDHRRRRRPAAGSPAAAGAAGRRPRRHRAVPRQLLRRRQAAAARARRRRGRCARVEAGALAERLDAPVIITINAKGILPPGHPLHAGENIGLAAAARGTARRPTSCSRSAPSSARPRCMPDPTAAAVRRQADPHRHRPGAADARLPGRLADRRRCPAGPVAPCWRLRAAKPIGVAARDAGGGIARGDWPSCGGRPCATHRRLLAMVQRGAARRRSSSATQTQPVYAGNQFFAADAAALLVQLEHRLRHAGLWLPAAIGAKLAAPDRPVVALIGDGGLQFTLPELASAVEAEVADHRPASGTTRAMARSSPTWPRSGISADRCRHLHAGLGRHRPRLWLCRRTSGRPRSSAGAAAGDQGSGGPDPNRGARRRMFRRGLSRRRSVKGIGGIFANASSNSLQPSPAPCSAGTARSCRFRC